MRCAECGAFVDVPEISDANLDALYDVYRKENGIVPLDVVCAIPEKYDIGKRPLSILLGWGELTFSRYCDGDVPTRQYSDILMRIYNEPKYYLGILEANKDKLKSERAYEKTRKAVDALINAEKKTSNKLDDVIQYLLNRCEDVTPLALQKALYYIQGFYYAFFGSFLFSEDCEAWVHGPVYRDVYVRYKEYRYESIEKAPLPDMSGFSANEKAVCDSVIDNICCYSGKVLERFTHNEIPWLKTRGDLPEFVLSDRVIDRSLIGEYFKAVKAKYNMINLWDIKDYGQDMFNQL